MFVEQSDIEVKEKKFIKEKKIVGKLSFILFDMWLLISLWKEKVR